MHTSTGVSKTNFTEKRTVTTTSYTWTGLTNGTTYYYVITAKNDYGESDGSNQIDATPSALPDTGQTQSYTDTFGEDSDYTINPPSYTDNADGTVTDNVTGLLWQQEDDDTKRTWDDAISYCNDLALAGYSAWRFPSVMELMTIVDYGTTYPAIDTTYFSGTNTTHYWSSTTYAPYSSKAWYVHFSYGYMSSHYKSNSYYVRCVQGGAYVPGDFTDNSDGTVTYGNTGLMWQQGEAGQMHWEDAIAYCEDLSLAGYTDWRLPNIKELRSITDDSVYDPAIDTNYFPDAHVMFYWSSTTNALNSSHAWDVNFNNGYVHYSNKSDNSYVRCVRCEQ